MGKESIRLRQIIERYPELTIRSFRSYNTEGQFTDILIVNEELVFRFPRYLHVAQSLQREMDLLSQIQPHLSLPVPDPIYQNKEGDSWEQVFMGYRLIPGETLQQKTLANLERQGQLDPVIRQIGTFLQELHGLPPETLAMDLPVADTVEEWAEMYADIRSQLFPSMRPDARDWVSLHFETFLNEPDLHVFEPRLRHGDFGASNILYDAARQTITGVIDFSFTGLGDPAVDIAAISTLGEPFFGRLQQSYPEIANLLDRARFYRGTFALQEALDGFRDQDKHAFDRGMAEYI